MRSIFFVLGFVLIFMGCGNTQSSENAPLNPDYPRCPYAAQTPLAYGFGAVDVNNASVSGLVVTCEVNGVTTVLTASEDFVPSWYVLIWDGSPLQHFNITLTAPGFVTQTHAIDITKSVSDCFGPTITGSDIFVMHPL